MPCMRLVIGRFMESGYPGARRARARSVRAPTCARAAPVAGLTEPVSPRHHGEKHRFTARDAAFGAGGSLPEAEPRRQAGRPSLAVRAARLPAVRRAISCGEQVAPSPNGEAPCGDSSERSLRDPEAAGGVLS